ncbi:MAG: glycogen/starch synthase, partial [Candidatus Omnitrophica bacterium]|nr:glycogen/starch synthase [Candidatus Omnitrophota bacterium]
AQAKEYLGAITNRLEEVAPNQGGTIQNSYQEARKGQSMTLTAEQWLDAKTQALASKASFVETLTVEGQKIGRIKTLNTARHDKDWYSSVYIFAFNPKNGKLYAQRRSQLKDFNAGKQDASATGHVEPGETSLDAACRIMKKELGVTLSFSDFVRIGEDFEYKIIEETKDSQVLKQFRTVYITIIPESQEVAFNPQEVKEVILVEVRDQIKKARFNNKDLSQSLKLIYEYSKVTEALNKTSKILKTIVKRVKCDLPLQEDLLFAVENITSDHAVRALVQVSPEAIPIIKTGGLGDVVGEYAQKIARLGINSYVFLLKYANLKDEGWVDTKVKFDLALNGMHGEWPLPVSVWKKTANDVTYFGLQDNGSYTQKIYSGDQYRQAILLCEGSLLAMEKLVETKQMINPDVIHTHDWQAGEINLLLETNFQNRSIFRNIAHVTSEHNPKQQGPRFSSDRFDEMRISGEHWFGIAIGNNQMSLKRGGLNHAQRIIFVSENNMNEALNGQGFGNDHIYQARRVALRGVPNGILVERWPALSEEKKQKAEQEVLKELDLDSADKDTVTIGTVARIDDQKDTKKLIWVVGQIMEETDGKLRFIYLGDGHPDNPYTGEAKAMMKDLVNRWPTKVKIIHKPDHAQTNRIMDGLQVFSYASRFEPFGTKPGAAVQKGIPLILTRVGGLAEFGKDWNPDTQEGNAVFLNELSDEELRKAIWTIINLYRNHLEKALKIRENARNTDMRWEPSVRKYVRIYQEVIDENKQKYHASSNLGKDFSVLLKYFNNDREKAITQIRIWQKELSDKLGDKKTLKQMTTFKDDAHKDGVEYLLTTDAKGKYTGKIRPRELCYNDGTWHRTVGMLVIDKDNRMAIQTRSRHKKSRPLAKDVSAGGHMGLQDDPFDAAKRELEEELFDTETTGFKIDPSRLIRITPEGVYVINDSSKTDHFDRELATFFAYDITEEEKKDIKLQESEVEIVSMQDLFVDMDQILRDFHGVTKDNDYAIGFLILENFQTQSKIKRTPQYYLKQFLAKRASSVLFNSYRTLGILSNQDMLEWLSRKVSAPNLVGKNMFLDKPVSMLPTVAGRSFLTSAFLFNEPLSSLAVNRGPDASPQAKGGTPTSLDILYRARRSRIEILIAAFSMSKPTVSHPRGVNGDQVSFSATAGLAVLAQFIEMGKTSGELQNLLLSFEYKIYEMVQDHHRGLYQEKNIEILVDHVKRQKESRANRICAQKRIRNKKEEVSSILRNETALQRAKKELEKEKSFWGKVLRNQNTYPLVGELHFGPTCGEGCIYCYSQGNLSYSFLKNSGDENKLLNREEIKRLVEEWRSIGIKQIICSGGLEFFTSKHAYYTLTLLKEAKIPVFIITSGSRIHKGDMAQLLYADAVRFSIDSFDRSIFCTIRTTADYNQVFSNLKALIQLREEKNAETVIAVSRMFLPHNFNEDENFIIKASEIGVDLVQFSVDYRRKEETTISPKKLEERVHALRERFGYNYQGLRIEYKEDLLNSEEKHINFEHCWSSYRKFVMDPFGNVYPCCIWAQPGISGIRNIEANVRKFEGSFIRLWSETNTFRRTIDPTRLCSFCGHWDLLVNEFIDGNKQLFLDDSDSSEEATLSSAISSHVSSSRNIKKVSSPAASSATSDLSKFFYMNSELKKSFLEGDYNEIHIVAAGGGGDLLGAIFLAKVLKLFRKMTGKRAIKVSIVTTNVKRGEENLNGGPTPIENLGIMDQRTGKVAPLATVNHAKHFYRIDQANIVSLVEVDAAHHKIEILIKEGAVVKKMQESGLDLIMIDVNPGFKAIAAEYHKIIKNKKVLILGLDMGGDILARYLYRIIKGKNGNKRNHPEKGIRSPITDTIILKSLCCLKARYKHNVLLGVSALGGDGELGKTLIRYLREFIDKDELLGVLDIQGFLRQAGPGGIKLLNDVLDLDISSEVSTNFIRRIQKAILGLAYRYSRHEREEVVIGWESFQGGISKESLLSLLDSLEVPIKVQKIRGGTRTETLIKAYLFTLFFDPLVIESYISKEIRDVLESQVTWDAVAKVFSDFGYTTEMDDINNKRDRISVRKFLARLYRQFVEVKRYSFLERSNAICKRFSSAKEILAVQEYFAKLEDQYHENKQVYYVFRYLIAFVFEAAAKKSQGDFGVFIEYCEYSRTFIDRIKREKYVSESILLVYALLHKPMAHFIETSKSSDGFKKLLRSLEYEIYRMAQDRHRRLYTEENVKEILAYVRKQTETRPGSAHIKNRKRALAAKRNQGSSSIPVSTPIENNALVVPMMPFAPSVVSSTIFLLSQNMASGRISRTAEISGNDQIASWIAENVTAPGSASTHIVLSKPVSMLPTVAGRRLLTPAFLSKAASSKNIKSSSTLSRKDFALTKTTASSPNPHKKKSGLEHSDFFDVLGMRKYCPENNSGDPYNIVDYMNYVVQFLGGGFDLLTTKINEIIAKLSAASNDELDYLEAVAKDIYAPLCYRVGFWKWATELSESVTKARYPEGYREAELEIVEALGHMTREQAEKYLEEIGSKIKKRLERNGIKVIAIYWRVKGAGSAYQKIESGRGRRGAVKNIGSLQDLLGLHVIVDKSDYWSSVGLFMGWRDIFAPYQELGGELIPKQTDVNVRDAGEKYDGSHFGINIPLPMNATKRSVAMEIKLFDSDKYSEFMYGENASWKYDLRKRHPNQQFNLGGLTTMSHNPEENLLNLFNYLKDWVYIFFVSINEKAGQYILRPARFKDGFIGGDLLCLRRVDEFLSLTNLDPSSQEGLNSFDHAVIYGFEFPATKRGKVKRRNKSVGQPLLAGDFIMIDPAIRVVLTAKEKKEIQQRAKHLRTLLRLQLKPGEFLKTSKILSEEARRWYSAGIRKLVGIGKNRWVNKLFDSDETVQALGFKNKEQTVAFIGRCKVSFDIKTIVLSSGSRAWLDARVVTIGVKPGNVKRTLMALDLSFDYDRPGLMSEVVDAIAKVRAEVILSNSFPKKVNLILMIDRERISNLENILIEIKSRDKESKVTVGNFVSKKICVLVDLNKSFYNFSDTFQIILAVFKGFEINVYRNNVAHQPEYKEPGPVNPEYPFAVELKKLHEPGERIALYEFEIGVPLLLKDEELIGKLEHRIGTSEVEIKDSSFVGSSAKGGKEASSSALTSIYVFKIGEDGSMTVLDPVDSKHDIVYVYNTQFLLTGEKIALVASYRPSEVVIAMKMLRQGKTYIGLWHAPRITILAIEKLIRVIKEKEFLMIQMVVYFDTGKRSMKLLEQELKLAYPAVKTVERALLHPLSRRDLLRPSNDLIFTTPRTVSIRPDQNDPAKEYLIAWSEVGIMSSSASSSLPLATKPKEGVPYDQATREAKEIAEKGLDPWGIKIPLSEPWVEQVLRYYKEDKERKPQKIDGFNIVIRAGPARDFDAALFLSSNHLVVFVDQDVSKAQKSFALAHVLNQAPYHLNTLAEEDFRQYQASQKKETNVPSGFESWHGVLVPQGDDTFKKHFNPKKLYAALLKIKKFPERDFIISTRHSRLSVAKKISGAHFCYFKLTQSEMFFYIRLEDGLILLLDITHQKKIGELTKDSQWIGQMQQVIDRFASALKKQRQGEMRAQEDKSDVCVSQRLAQALSKTLPQVTYVLTPGDGRVHFFVATTISLNQVVARFRNLGYEVERVKKEIFSLAQKANNKKYVLGRIGSENGKIIFSPSQCRDVKNIKDVFNLIHVLVQMQRQKETKSCQPQKKSLAGSAIKRALIMFVAIVAFNIFSTQVVFGSIADTITGPRYGTIFYRSQSDPPGTLRYQATVWDQNLPAKNTVAGVLFDLEALDRNVYGTPIYWTGVKAFIEQHGELITGHVYQLTAFMHETSKAPVAETVIADTDQDTARPTGSRDAQDIIGEKATPKDQPVPEITQEDSVAEVAVIDPAVIEIDTLSLAQEEPKVIQEPDTKENKKWPWFLTVMMLIGLSFYTIVKRRAQKQDKKIVQPVAEPVIAEIVAEPVQKETTEVVEPAKKETIKIIEPVVPQAEIKEPAADQPVTEEDLSEFVGNLVAEQEIEEVQALDKENQKKADEILEKIAALCSELTAKASQDEAVDFDQGQDIVEETQYSAEEKSLQDVQKFLYERKILAQLAEAEEIVRELGEKNQNANEQDALLKKFEDALAVIEALEAQQLQEKLENAEMAKALQVLYRKQILKHFAHTLRLEINLFFKSIKGFFSAYFARKGAIEGEEPVESVAKTKPVDASPEVQVPEIFIAPVTEPASQAEVDVAALSLPELKMHVKELIHKARSLDDSSESTMILNDILDILKKWRNKNIGFDEIIKAMEKEITGIIIARQSEKKFKSLYEHQDSQERVRVDNEIDSALQLPDPIQRREALEGIQIDRTTNGRVYREIYERIQDATGNDDAAAEVIKSDEPVTPPGTVAPTLKPVEAVVKTVPARLSSEEQANQEAVDRLINDMDARYAQLTAVQSQDEEAQAFLDGFVAEMHIDQKMAEMRRGQKFRNRAYQVKILAQLAEAEEIVRELGEKNQNANEQDALLKKFEDALAVIEALEAQQLQEKLENAEMAKALQVLYRKQILKHFAHTLRLEINLFFKSIKGFFSAYFARKGAIEGEEPVESVAKTKPVDASPEVQLARKYLPTVAQYVPATEEDFEDFAGQRLVQKVVDANYAAEDEFGPEIKALATSVKKMRAFLEAKQEDDDAQVDASFKQLIADLEESEAQAEELSLLEDQTTKQNAVLSTRLLHIGNLGKGMSDKAQNEKEGDALLKDLEKSLDEITKFDDERKAIQDKQKKMPKVVEQTEPAAIK